MRQASTGVRSAHRRRRSQRHHIGRIALRPEAARAVALTNSPQLVKPYEQVTRSDLRLRPVAELSEVADPERAAKRPVDREVDVTHGDFDQLQPLGFPNTYRLSSRGHCPANSRCPSSKSRRELAGANACLVLLVNSASSVWASKMMRWRYSNEEDAIILNHMQDVDTNVHREVLRRCVQLSEQCLPHRAPEGIRDRWYTLIGKRRRSQNWKNKIQDLADLLSPEQRKRIKVRLPAVRISRRSQGRTTGSKTSSASVRTAQQHGNGCP